MSRAEGSRDSFRRGRSFDHPAPAPLPAALPLQTVRPGEAAAAAALKTEDGRTIPIVNEKVILIGISCLCGGLQECKSSWLPSTQGSTVHVNTTAPLAAPNYLQVHARLKIPTFSLLSRATLCGAARSRQPSPQCRQCMHAPLHAGLSPTPQSRAQPQPQWGTRCAMLSQQNARGGAAGACAKRGTTAAVGVHRRAALCSHGPAVPAPHPAGHCY